MRKLATLIAIALLNVAACKGADTQAPEPLGTSQAGAGAGVGAAKRPAPVSPRPVAEAEYEERSYQPVDDYYEEQTIAGDADKPGLGTAYGEARQSTVTTAPFVRARARRPDTVLAVWYDSVAGARHLVDWKGAYYDGTAYEQSEDRALSVSLLDEWGKGLQGLSLDDRRYAVGEVGQRYMIGIQNNGGERFEAVVSVDGLDVIDGEQASYSKRGYIVEPYTSMTIEGWRTSMDTVAAFRFSALEDSYADRKGKGRNVGVVGVAFFGAKQRREPRRRGAADPFPGSP